MFLGLESTILVPQFIAFQEPEEQSANEQSDPNYQFVAHGTYIPPLNLDYILHHKTMVTVDFMSIA